MKKKFLKSSNSSTVIFLVFLLAVNFLVSQKSLYLDLTQDKIYTASPVTKDILGNLDKPVNVTFYISGDLPADYVIYKTQVQDLVGQYSDLAQGKLEIKYEEPATDDTAVAALEQSGIQQLQSQVVEKDKIEVKRFFFGAKISSGEGEDEKKEVLSTLPELASFEYNFMAAVNSVSKEQKEIVAFLGGHGEKEINTAELEKSYEVEHVAISAEEGKTGFYVDDQATADAETSDASKVEAPAEKEFVTPKTVIIAGPQSKLSEGEIAVLDGFVAGGGKVVVLAERINFDAEQGFVTKNIDNNMSDFTKKYGIEINNDLVYDKSNSPISYGKQTYFGTMTMTSDYPFWVKALQENFGDHPSLSKIQTLTLLWVSSLSVTGNDDYDVQSLVTSTSGSQAISENIDISPESNLIFSNGGKKTLAALSKAKNGEGQVVVIADSDFVSPSFMQSTIPDNETFFLNLVDSISSSASLSSIRSKNISERPLREVSESARNTWKFIALAGGAIILSAYGLMRINKRKKISRG